ncbi:hypothetical protein HPP92_010530 [Vanilla planifolia]|uniref:Alpha/beta hydrolase fold-3 domain-containing protein n=1 Tax=Vanilla planifolia TaxID=51239 RepID=A0A835R496_VANPL|nr:hypothetical protein HPP92_010530 [Vanilla planifolia]
MDNCTTFEEVDFEVPNYFRYYRSGRVERLAGTAIVPPSLDPITGVESRDVVLDSSTAVSARLYLPLSISISSIDNRKLPVVVYFHGGGFCIESAASPTYHHHLNVLTALTPLLAVSVDYRLAPEHRLPAAYDDGWTALHWVLSRSDPWVARHGDLRQVFLAGDSAGANIAHQVAMRAAGKGLRLKGLALVHPFFWGSEPVGFEPADPVFRARMNQRWWFTCPGAVGPDDPRWNPTGEAAPSLAGLGCERVLVTVAEMDYLKHRGRLYYEKLKASGWKGEAELVETAEEGHVFHLREPESAKALAQLRLLAAFLGRE